MEKEIDFKELSKHYFDDLDKELSNLVSINSVYDEKTITNTAPYGKGVEKALNYVKELGTRLGFESKIINNRCAELTIGSGKKLIGIFGHTDVVPATGKWDSDPFSVSTRGDKMYGRGVSDDKGPFLASLFATKLLADHGLIKDYRVRIVIGGDEERGASCLINYFEDKNREIPDYGFTPDADFPVVYGEKGIANLKTTFDVAIKNVTSIEAGIVPNAVIDKAVVTLKENDDGFTKYLKDNKVDVDINDKSLTFNGQSAHGSTPEEGINSAIIALKCLASYYKNEKLLTLVDKISDTTGKAFACCYKTSNLGQTTFNIGILSYKDNTLQYVTNFRYPENVSATSLVKDYDKELLAKTTILSNMSYLLFDKESPLIKKLMEAYQKETGDMEHGPIYLGGGTYAKDARNTVAFGAVFPGENTHMHEPNEFMVTENLHKCISIYAHAIYLLGK